MYPTHEVAQDQEQGEGDRQPHAHGQGLHGAAVLAGAGVLEQEVQSREQRRQDGDQESHDDELDEHERHDGRTGCHLSPRRRAPTKRRPLRRARKRLGLVVPPLSVVHARGRRRLRPDRVPGPVAAASRRREEGAGSPVRRGRGAAAAGADRRHRAGCDAGGSPGQRARPIPAGAPAVARRPGEGQRAGLRRLDAAAPGRRPPADRQPRLGAGRVEPPRAAAAAGAGRAAGHRRPVAHTARARPAPGRRGLRCGASAGAMAAPGAVSHRGRPGLLLRRAGAGRGAAAGPWRARRLRPRVESQRQRLSAGAALRLRRAMVRLRPDPAGPVPQAQPQAPAARPRAKPMNDPTLKSSRRQFLLLLAIFAMPVLAAYVVYFLLPGLRPRGTTTYGQLVQPTARPLPALSLADADGKPEPANLFKGKWSMVYLAPADCAETCKGRVYHSRQIRTALDRDARRLQRVYIAPDAAALAAAKALLGVEHPDLVLAADNGAPGSRAADFFQP